uniref:Phenylalanine--tRNA ligase beta subunit, chloroplastic n=1 Tax=Entomoneis sp. TaxID=186043 RepID=A0A2U9NQL9_9STRA|nr:phenylalanine-tRNA ligase beta subunit [Entomoneis sp.]AWT39408.1 phenylalanine-tRNA ligase beta subunit [Entomoneis sp.]
MQISISWINELIDIENVKLEDLIDKLTLGGFEVEEVLELEINNKKETVLDISATANRSDSLSVQGISSEIGTLLNKQPKNVPYLQTNTSWTETVKNSTVNLPENETCETLLAVAVKNVTDFSSPQWLKNKLISSGLTPANDLSDFQNYIVLETGYPFMVYDFEKINSKVDNKKLNVSISKPNTTLDFLASNNLNYELTTFNELISVNDIPIGIAGIIEGQDFMCTAETNSLLIEGSIFNAAKIRKQSRELGLRTEQSARHEKSLKTTYLIEATYRLISLLRIKNPNLSCQLITYLATEQKPLNSIVLNYKTLNETLGPTIETTETEIHYIPLELINNYLERLNFAFSFNEREQNWEIKIPHLRSDDITREIDLIEEIGRLHGFNNFLTTLPKLKNVGNEDLSYKTRKKLTSCLLNIGLNELTHYSLVNEKTFVANDLELINPLSAEFANLRSSILPSLIKTVEENVKQGNSMIEGFEYGHVFFKNADDGFAEKENIAGIFGGTKTKLSWSTNPISLNWFEAKGKLEELFEQLSLQVNWTKSINPNNIFHPYKTSELSLENGSTLGVFGQISPLLADELNIDKEIYLFEFNLGVIEKQIQKNQLAIYKPYVIYPKIVKDIAFIVHQDIAFAELKKALHLNGTQYLSEVNLLDEYRGNTIPEDHVSLCLQLIFQSEKKTLQTKEIEVIVENLQLLLNEKFGALLRT